VFPDVHAEERLAFATGDGLAHERIVLVRRGDDFQLAVVGDEPDPAAAETADARRLELRLEIIEAAERGLDVVGELAGGRAAGLGPRIFQKNEWFQWPPPLLRTGPRMLSGHGREILDERSSDLASSAALPAMALLRLST
jgi:hypothetical protein